MARKTSRQRSLFEAISLGFANGFGSAWFFIFMVLVLVSWIALGAPMHWSNTWQLIANTPTTWIELFAAITIQYLTNIIQALQEKHQAQLDKMLRHIEKLAEKLEVELNHEA